MFSVENCCNPEPGKKCSLVKGGELSMPRQHGMKSPSSRVSGAGIRYCQVACAASTRVVRRTGSLDKAQESPLSVGVERVCEIQSRDLAMRAVC